MGMAALSAEQLEKINDLVRGKFYKITPPPQYLGLRNPIRISRKIGRFQNVVNDDARPNRELLLFGPPSFTHRDEGEDPCLYDGPSMVQNYLIPVSWIDNIVPINAPEDAGADWVPSVFCGGARKTRRGRASRSKRSKRSKRGSRRK